MKLSPLTQTILGSKNLGVITEKQMHPQSVTVWCGFWVGGITFSLFYENVAGWATIVNSAIATHKSVFLCCHVPYIAQQLMQLRHESHFLIMYFPVLVFRIPNLDYAI